MRRPWPRIFTTTAAYVQPFPPTGAVYQAPRQQFDFHPVWSRTGTELIYTPSASLGRLAAVPVATQSGVTFGAAVFLPAPVTANRIVGDTRTYDVLPDGRLIGLTEAAAADSPAAAEIRVILNWHEELKRLVPTR